METRFVSIDAKRITVWGAVGAEQASGGGAAVYYTCRPRAPRRPQAGKVLQLEDYRRRMEEAGAPGPAAEREPPCPERAVRPARRSRRGLALDFAATAAIVCMALVFVVKLALL